MNRTARFPLPVVTLEKPDAEALSPYGTFIDAASQAGQRRFFSEHLQTRQPRAEPVLHVNHIRPSALPLEVTQLERHPYAAQCFMPLDVSRYVVAVMPSDRDGQPVPARTLAFLMPPTLGVIYHPGVWHLGATVLDRTGHFVVLMWRGGKGPDDDFRSIDPISLVLSSDHGGAVDPRPQPGTETGRTP